MAFSSVSFLFGFLPGFFLLYYLLPWRNTVLLLGSLAFYAWGAPGDLPLLLLCIAANWAIGLAIPAARWLLPVGVALNIGALFRYKYATFLLGWGAGAPHLPLGISFFTFQGVSYLADVARGTVRPQRSLLAYATFKAMFPQLIAGPVIRYADVAARIARRRTSLLRVRFGIELFLLGLAQKVLVADSVAPTADAVFATPAADLTPATARAGALCYAIQIAFDFGGYSTMATGLGHMLGFAFPRNFDRPYAAQSVTAFWRRWHMTLSAWFRDYLYIPLGGSRGSPARTYVNLAAVFLLCGLWHGAAWNFVAWGAWHGFFLVLERGGWVRIPWRPARHAYLLAVVLFGWVLFRADSLPFAIAVAAAMLGLAPGDPVLHPLQAVMPPSAVAALLVGAVLAVLPRRGRTLPGSAPLGVMEGAAALLLGGLAMTLAAGGTYSPFIYYRF